MFRSRVTALAACWLATSPGALAAQSVSANGSPSLTVSTAVAGFDLTPASDATATVSVTTTAANQKLTARLQTALPAGVTLTITIAAPSGATSLGPVSLTTSNQNVVTGIPSAGTYSNLQVTYTLTGTAGSGPVSTTLRTVVISLFDPP